MVPCQLLACLRLLQRKKRIIKSIMVKKRHGQNLRLAGLFVAIVFVLVIISLLFKFILVLREGKFDGNHKIVIAFVGSNNTSFVGFSPENKSISILKFSNTKDIQKHFDIPVDGKISNSSDDISTSQISSKLFKSALTFGKDLEDITFIDALRLFIFTKGVPFNAIYDRKITPDLTNQQISTLVYLTFSDPTIYQENQSIQIINSTSLYGLGNKLANFISNMGGNVVLVSTANTENKISTIEYYKTKSYTVNKINSYLNFSLIKSDKRGVADVIITIGKDKLDKINY